MKIILKNQLKATATLACMGMFAMAIVQSGSAQNLLADPDFANETVAPNPNPNGVPGWANFGGTTFASPSFAIGSPNALYTPDEGGNYSVPGTYQDFAASPGQTFTFSGWVYTPNALVANDNDFAIFQLSFFTGAPPNNYAGGTGVGAAVDEDIGDPIGGGGVALPQGVWTFASVTATAGAGVNSVGAYILDINADANADFYFDEMSLTASPVPEPATLSLCALGLMGMAGFRFRRKV
jgi:hypothetical protein